MKIKLVVASILCIGMTLACSPLAPSVSKKNSTPLAQTQSLKEGSPGDATFDELHTLVVSDKSPELGQKNSLSVSEAQVEEFKEKGSAELALGPLPPTQVFLVTSMSLSEIEKKRIQAVKFKLARKASGSGIWILSPTPQTRLQNSDALEEIRNSLEKIEIILTEKLS